MPIICFKGNKNNTRKRNVKTKQQQQQQQQQKQNKWDGSCSVRVRDKWFCWAFKLGFLQLIR